MIIRLLKTGALSIARTAIIVIIASCTTIGEAGDTLPANFPQAAKLQRVAVLEFSGKGSDETTSALEAALVAHQVNDEPYFRVMDRARTKDLYAEVARGMRGEVAPGTAARFGKQVGVQGVFFGRVNSQEVNNRNYIGKQYTCIRRSNSGCDKSGHINASCTEVTATVALMPRVVDVETGQVVYAQERTGTATSSYCSGDSITSGDTLVARARDRAISEIIRDVAPHSKRVGDYIAEGMKSLLKEVSQ
jgi:curli biogenesis system outer membrane secretion channel CsgG